MHLLFSYGTLADPDVQHALFGRRVPTEADAMQGFRMDYVTITDPDVIATSGSDRHPILRRGQDTDLVPGACLELSADELAVADRYEVADYTRVRVPLQSGRKAWVYVSADEVCAEQHRAST